MSRVGSKFFRQYDSWLNERFPSDKGKHYISAHKRFVGGLSEWIDPIRPLFKPWHFGWTDKEDINYFNFWYSDRADLVTLDLPERWRNILHRGVEDRFCDLCYGLSGYLRGYHSKRGRYSNLYAYFKKFFNLIDSEIFWPASVLGEGTKSDVKTALASLFYTTYQKKEFIDSFVFSKKNYNKKWLPLYHYEIKSLDGDTLWDSDHIKKLRDLIHRDLDSGFYPDSVTELARCVSCPDISVYDAITVPTENEEVPFRDPWTIKG